MSATLSLQQPQLRPAAKLDTLSRILADLCKPGGRCEACDHRRWSSFPQPITHQPYVRWRRAGVLERREDHVLRDFVDAERRSYSAERFNRFLGELYSRVKSLVLR